jgi:hypothetical protein
MPLTNTERGVLFRRLLVLALVTLTAPGYCGAGEEVRNQLQNGSFEEDWLVSEALARRRWGLIARAEVGYGWSDGKLDHWEAPAEWRDRSVAHSGRCSIKLSVGRILAQSVRASMRSPAKGNPAGQETDFKPLDPKDLAKLEARVVRGGAWVKADGLADGKAKIIISASNSRTPPKKGPNGKPLVVAPLQAEAAVPGGTYDWRRVEVASPEAWPAAEQMTIAVQGADGLWVDDAFLGEEPLGANLAVNGDLEKLDAKGWPEGYSAPQAFWWFRFDYYSWTGWGHDGGYGCQIPERIDLVPGYRWRGHAAVDSLISHSGRNSLRLVAYPGDQFGVLGPAVAVDGSKPFEIGAWVRADRIHQVELMAVDADTNKYVLMDTDHFAGLEAVGVGAGSKGQGTYDWTYLRKLICPTAPPQNVRPLVAVRGFDGRIIEKNHVGTVWFDDIEIIQRGGGQPTPASLAPATDVRVTGFDLGDRLWGRNFARATLLSGATSKAELKLTVTSPKGQKQEAAATVDLNAGKAAVVELPYRIDDLCRAWNEQYAVELAVTAGGRTRTIQTAFGTPSSLLATRLSHQYLFPEEKLVVAANVLASEASLKDVAQVAVQVTDSQGKPVTQFVVDDPASKLPVLVPEVLAAGKGKEHPLEYLNIDRCVTMVPELAQCAVRPWREATRDYTITVRLTGKDGKELARAEGMRFGRITHFDPSELKWAEKRETVGKGVHRCELQSKVEVNDQHFLLVDGKPFFPVYFGEYGDTFRPTEGINIDRDQLASLGINPHHLSADEKKKYGMDAMFGCGEWDLNGMFNLKPEAIVKAIEAFKADNPGKLVVSGYDMVSHPGSRRADVAAYYFPAYDIGGMEASFASYAPNLRVDYYPAMTGKHCAIMVGFEHYYFVPFEELRYRSYLTVMRGAGGLGLIPSRMMMGLPECNNYLRGLNAECRSLAPVFCAPEAKAPTQASQTGLFTWEKELDGKRYLFVVRGEPFLRQGLLEWSAERKAPSGKPSHSEPRYAKLAQHWLQNTKTFDVTAGDTIVQELYVEGKAPRMIALQFRTRTSTDNTWEHRAYWGKAELKRFAGEAEYPADHKPPEPWPAWMVVEDPAQPINSACERGAAYFEVLGGQSCKAVDGAPSMKRMGDVPASGQWITVKVPAKDVALEGQRLDGICFSVDAGQVFWGKSAIVGADGKERILIDGSLENLAVDPGPWTVRFTVPGAAKVQVKALFENVGPKADGNSFEDGFPVPFRARVYEITAQ